MNSHSISNASIQQQQQNNEQIMVLVPLEKYLDSTKSKGIVKKPIHKAKSIKSSMVKRPEEQKQKNKSLMKKSSLEKSFVQNSSNVYGKSTSGKQSKSVNSDNDAFYDLSSIFNLKKIPKKSHTNTDAYAKAAATNNNRSGQQKQRTTKTIISSQPQTGPNETRISTAPEPIIDFDDLLNKSVASSPSSSLDWLQSIMPNMSPSLPSLNRPSSPVNSPMATDSVITWITSNTPPPSFNQPVHSPTASINTSSDLCAYNEIKQNIIDEEHIHQYSKTLLSTFKFPSVLSADELNARQSYLNYRLEWRLRGAIKLVVGDMKAKFNEIN